MVGNNFECLVVPVDLCLYVITNKLVNPFKLYLFLKILGGRVIVDQNLKLEIAKTLNIKSLKTVDVNLRKLIQLNWIGTNSDGNIYYIRGFETVTQYIQSDKRLGVEFYKSDFNNFRGFLAGAIYGFLSIIQRWNLRAKGGVKGLYKGRSFQLTHPLYFFPVSIIGFSKIVSISLSTAHNFKEDAVKAKKIVARQNLIPVGIEPNMIMKFSKSYPQKSGKLKVVKNEVFEIGPLLVKATMRYKRRKKTKHIIGGQADSNELKEIQEELLVLK